MFADAHISSLAYLCSNMVTFSFIDYTVCYLKSKEVSFDTVSKLMQYYYHKWVNNKMLQSD